MKTLKDLIHIKKTRCGCSSPQHNFDTEIVNKEKLRQAAIERIKFYFDESKKHEPHSHGEQCSLAAAHALIEFCNITEEDLKNV